MQKATLQTPLRICVSPIFPKCQLNFFLGQAAARELYGGVQTVVHVAEIYDFSNSLVRIIIVVYSCIQYSTELITKLLSRDVQCFHLLQPSNYQKQTNMFLTIYVLASYIMKLLLIDKKNRIAQPFVEHPVYECQKSIQEENFIKIK